MHGQGCSLTRSLGGHVGSGGGMRRDERLTQGGVEQVEANCGRSSGVVGLCTIHQCIAGLPGWLPSLGTTSFQSQPRQTHLVGGTDTNRLRWVAWSAIRRPLPGPLISGSEAIMPMLFWIVKCFVVLFFKHYIFSLRRLISQFLVLQFRVSTLTRKVRSSRPRVE